VSQRMGEKLLLIPDWTDDRVMAFSHTNGDIVNANFIPNSAPLLASPKEAILSPKNTITVSDQIADLVQEFSVGGTFLRTLAPAGGVNTAILDNLRGHAYLNNGNLLVAVGSSANQNSIAHFDTSGSYLGQFITAGSGGLNSPFGILIRDSDILVTASTSNAVHRYDLNGAFLNNLITGLNFPQQIIKLANGDLAVAVFSTPTTGVRIYSATGTLLNHFTGVTGNRGVYPLANGNYLTTNGSGVHEINGTSGILVRTVFSSSNMQYVTLYDPDVIPVELASFTASASGNSVMLKWITATETNNAGFDIERMVSGVWERIGYVKGNGSRTEVTEYNYSDNGLIPGVYSYRLNQIDYDGTSRYYNLSETVEIELPSEYILLQNYPHPFNPETKITYAIPAAGNISIKLYDIKGSEIGEIEQGFREAGYHAVSLNAQSYNLTSGVYIYKLKAGSFSSQKKLVLLK
jgi:hypothetical protein